jgi:dTDP-4-dehydrorhamnose reductase
MATQDHKINIIIFGSSGQIGSSLLGFLKKNNSFFVEAFCSADVDFSNLKDLELFLDNLKYKPQIIVNAAAYTNVDKAETDKELAELINHQAVKVIANFCNKKNVTLIHYSTDYVFDGSGSEPFMEDNTKNLKPLNHYGVTKFEAEKAIKDSGCNYAILRTSWIWSRNPKSINFFITITKLAKERDEIRIVADQVGAPTSANFVAKKTIKIIKKILKSKNLAFKEIYHIFEGMSYISWYDFAVKIVDNLRKKNHSIKVQNLIAIKSSEYKTAATRPLNSRLGTIKKI